MQKPDVRWGFIGAGHIARTALAPAVHAATGATLQAVAAREARRARLLSPAGGVYDAYEQLLDDSEVDAVYISLANDAHAYWTIQALRAGKHVLCEKPLGLNRTEVTDMTSAAESSGRLLVEATWNRWHPRTRRAEALVRSGLIGAVTHVDTGFTVSGPAPGNYRLAPNGGGALYDLGCYAIVAALWATGSQSADVREAQSLLNETGVDMRTRARLSMADAVVDVECAMQDTPAQWLRITGTEGSLEFPEAFVMSRNSPSSLQITNDAGTRTEWFAPVDTYTVMVEHVSAAVRGEVCFLPPTSQSIAMITVLEAIQASSMSS